MKITIEQAGSLLNRAGYHVTVSNKHLTQDVGPYENCEEVKKGAGKWVYGRRNIERLNTPYTKTMKEFTTEEEASTYFLLKKLASHYGNTIFTPFNLKHQVDLRSDVFDVTMLYQALQTAGISANKFYFNDSPKGTCMHLEKIDADKWILSLVANGRMLNSSIPLDDYPWALRIAYRGTFLLHLFQTEVPKLLQSEGITEQLTDEEMSIFIFG